MAAAPKKEGWDMFSGMVAKAAGGAQPHAQAPQPPAAAPQKPPKNDLLDF